MSGTDGKISLLLFLGFETFELDDEPTLAAPLATQPAASLLQTLDLAVSQLQHVNSHASNLLYLMV